MGKVRHLDLADLWAQEKVRSGTVELCKVLENENPADVLTKHVDQKTLTKLLSKIGMYAPPGRASCAPEIV